MLTDAQKADRLALIKEIADRVQAKRAFKTKAKVSTSKIRKILAPEYAAEKRRLDKFDREIAKMDENYNQWTDAPKYAEKYYGDVYRDTTRFDNEWN